MLHILSSSLKQELHTHALQHLLSSSSFVLMSVCLLRVSDVAMFPVNMCSEFLTTNKQTNKQTNNKNK